MSQQNHQEHKVEVGECTVKESRNSPAEGGHDLGDVVEVTGHTPPARHQQETRLLLSTGCVVGSLQRGGSGREVGVVQW